MGLQAFSALWLRLRRRTPDVKTTPSPSLTVANVSIGTNTKIGCSISEVPLRYLAIRQGTVLVPYHASWRMSTDELGGRRSYSIWDLESFMGKLCFLTVHYPLLTPCLLCFAITCHASIHAKSPWPFCAAPKWDGCYGRYLYPSMDVTTAFVLIYLFRKSQVNCHLSLTSAFHEPWLALP